MDSDFDSPLDFICRSARRPGRTATFIVILLIACTCPAHAAQFTLEWVDNAVNETGFEIERATASSGAFALIATTGPNVTSYVDDGLAASTQYQYRVRATNSAGDSSYSNTVTGVTPPPPNTPPTVSAIPNQSIVEDGAINALGFSVADLETSTDALLVTCTSSNPLLIPASSITVNGSGAARSITARPAPNASGTATLTLVVSDGELATSRSFVVTVATVNDAPGISEIADRYVQSTASSGLIGFNVDDLETAAGNLAVSASSSNQVLLPNTVFIFGGSGSSRTLTFTPPTTTTGGTATVTVRVSDGSLTTSDTFLVTITPANTAPTISDLADRTVQSATSSGAIAFTVADKETAATSLLVSAVSPNATLLPDAALSLGGSGSNRTLTFTPPTTTTGGTATVTVRVSDGSLTTTDTFVVTITPANTAPTISDLADRTVQSATSSGAIAFTIADKETAATSLLVSAVSSNATLLPDAALSLGGSGSNRTLTFTPPTTTTGGTATVTVRVSDGSLTTSDTFVITITPANTAPTISAISAQAISVNSSTAALPFTIGDSQTPAENLTLVTSASNTALVPVGNIIFGGSGAARTVTIRPVSNTTGWSTIWIKVSDGTLSRTTSFVINVSSALFHEDIGSPALPGSQTVTGNTIEMRAGGTDIWGGSDQFRFAHQPLIGDSEMTVRVATLTNSHAWAKAGLMYRGSTDANAPYVFVLLSPTNGVALQYRASAGAAAAQKYAKSVSIPQWLKLTRSGNTFYAFHSNDGATWELVDYVTVDLPDIARAGLAVTSHSATTSTTAVFENLSVD